MNDAALARRHGVEFKRLARCQHTLRGDSGRHSQFLKSQRPVARAIDLNFFVPLRFELQNAVRQVFERLQHFAAALQEQFLVRTIQVGQNFRFTFGDRRMLRQYGHLQREPEATCTNRVGEKISQRFGRGGAVELAIEDRRILQFVARTRIVCQARGIRLRFFRLGRLAGRRNRMRAVQIILLHDADETARENVDRESR